MVNFAFLHHKLSKVHKLNVPLLVDRKLTLDPSLFRGRVLSAHQKHRQKEANLEILVNNACCQGNARGVLELRHFSGYNDLIL